MRLKTDFPYQLAGSAKEVTIKRLWDDDEDHDYLNHIAVDGNEYRVGEFFLNPSRFMSPGAFWVLVRLGATNPFGFTKGSHNRREDAVLLDGIDVWIIDEPRVIVENHPGAEHWVVKPLLEFTALFLPISMTEYAEKMNIDIREFYPKV